MFPLSEPPGLVIFDCDGVLVDSEPISGPILRAHLAASGLALSAEDIDARFKGRTMPDIAVEIRERHGLTLDQTWIQAYRDATNAAFEKELQSIPHVHDAVVALCAANVRLCVASSGPVEKMNVSLGVTGLLTYFEDLLFSAWDVPRGKPHPDVFLHAAEQMSTAPADCVVIEDSQHGIAAARAAGMRTLAYLPEESHSLVDGRTAHAFADMRALPSLLGL